MAGDMVVFEDGTYTTTATCWMTNSSRHGTASRPIVLKARNRHEAKLFFSGLPKEKIFITQNYVTIQDFDITQNAPGTTTLDKFINCYNNSHCRIIGNRISGGFEECIKGYRTQHLLVEGNTCFGFANEGIDVVNSHATVVRDNLIYDVGRNGILLKGGIRNGSIYNNRVESRSRPMDAGIVIGGVTGSTSTYSTSGHEAYHTVAWNNIISAAGAGGIRLGMMLQGAKDSAFVHNNVLNAHTAMQTSAGGDPSNMCGSGCVAWKASSVNPTFRNNIIAGCSVGAVFKGGETVRSVDYNLFDSCSNSPRQANPVSGDPLFTATQSDWRLRPRSAAIDKAGVLPTFARYSDSLTPSIPAPDISIDLYGQKRILPWDVGAAEFQGEGKSPSGADLNGDGSVGITDLSILLSRWGTADAAADLNGDGTVSIADLSILLSRWG